MRTLIMLTLLVAAFAAPVVEDRFQQDLESFLDGADMAHSARQLSQMDIEAYAYADGYYTYTYDYYDSGTVDKTDFVEVALTLDVTFDSATHKKGSAFATAFTADLAAALGVNTDRIEIQSIAAGSVVVTFRILGSSSGKKPADLFKALKVLVDAGGLSLGGATAKSIEDVTPSGTTAAPKLCDLLPIGDACGAGLAPIIGGVLLVLFLGLWCTNTCGFKDKVKSCCPCCGSDEQGGGTQDMTDGKAAQRS